MQGNEEEDIDREFFGKVFNLRGVWVRECMIFWLEIENIDVIVMVEDLE